MDEKKPFKGKRIVLRAQEGGAWSASFYYEDTDPITPRDYNRLTRMLKVEYGRYRRDFRLKMLLAKKKKDEVDDG